MTWLFNWFQGGKIAAIFAAIGAFALLVWRVLADARRQGAADQKAKEANRYAEDVDKAARAARARDDVLSGRLRPDDADPNRRD